MYNNIELVSFLIQSGANLDIKNIHGETAFMIAAQAGHIECVKSLTNLPSIKDYLIKNKDNVDLINGLYKELNRCLTQEKTTDYITLDNLKDTDVVNLYIHISPDNNKPFVTVHANDSSQEYIANFADESGIKGALESTMVASITTSTLLELKELVTGLADKHKSASKPRI
jgi:ankyrin repeat protein